MNRAIPNQTDRGDWALGSWELGPTRDRAVRPGMPGLALPETLPGPESARGRVWACPNGVGKAWEVGESIDIRISY